MRRARTTIAPQGGIQVHADALRRWRWREGQAYSAPLRCRRDQWYLVRATTGPDDPPPAVIRVQFLRDGWPLEQRGVGLASARQDERGAERLGWMLTPDQATHVRLEAPRGGDGQRLRIVWHAVEEHDAVCHPLARVPRWSAYLPAQPIERIMLPAPLEPLADWLAGCQTRILSAVPSRSQLARAACGGACIVDSVWVDQLGLTLQDLQKLADEAWVLIDLPTLAVLLRRCRVESELAEFRSPHSIVCARVEYADAATRGFALQDTFPYGTVGPDGAFQMRVLRATRGWRRYGERTGFHLLLSSQTPWQRRCGDVLATFRAGQRGRLVASDAPWLAAGVLGRPIAPRLARHLVRMQLGRPLSDEVQYWTGSHETDVLVRDIAEMPRRYPPLRAVRWASGERGVAALGLMLPATGAGRASRPPRWLIIDTGRIDAAARQPGVAPEPMMIFMKWLAREVRETRPLAHRLADTSVTWRFRTAAGLRYTVLYEAAPPARGALERSVRLTADDAPQGILGDGSLQAQAALTHRLRACLKSGRAAADV